MSDGSLPVGNTGQNLDTVKIDTTAGFGLHREGVFIGDPNSGLARAQVVNAQPGSGYGMGVWVLGSPSVTVGNFPASQTINGSVSVSNFPATQAVTVTSQPVTRGTVTVSASGDTVVYTPAAGKAIRLYFFGYSAGASVSGITVQLKLAGYNSGNPIDTQYLIAAGQAFSRNMEGGDRYIQGAVNGSLTVNLSGAQAIYFNYELDEV